MSAMARLLTNQCDRNIVVDVTEDAPLWVVDRHCSLAALYIAPAVGAVSGCEASLVFQRFGRH